MSVRHRASARDSKDGPRDDGSTRALRAVLAYSAGGILPALTALVSVSIYTTLLRPKEYGQYALLVSGSGFAGLICFGGIRLAAVRYRAANDGPERRDFLATLWLGTLGGAGLLCIGAIPFCFVGALSREPGLLALGVGYVISYSLAELAMSLHRAELQPLRYNVMKAVRALAGLGVGAAVALAYPSAHAPVVGLMVGSVAALMFSGGVLAAKDGRPKIDQLQKLIRYGLPLTLTIGLDFLVAAGDRFLIAGLVGVADAGVYSVAYDLTQQSLGSVVMFVNLATYPVIVRSFEVGGRIAAYNEMIGSGSLLLAIGVPACVGLSVIAPHIAFVLLEQEYVEQVGIVIPIVAVGVLFGAIKSYHFDISFYLSGRTAFQSVVSVLLVILNGFLNWGLIPRWHQVGAAVATGITYGVGLLLSAWIGRRDFAVPFPWRTFAKVLFASSVMGGLLWGLSSLLRLGVWQLAVLLIGGIALYLGMALALDIADSRRLLSRLVLKFPREGSPS